MKDTFEITREELRILQGGNGSALQVYPNIMRHLPEWKRSLVEGAEEDARIAYNLCEEIRKR